MAVQIINSPSSPFHHSTTMSMKKKLLIAAVIAVLTGVAFAYYLYNKPHQSIADDEPAFTIDAKMLVSDYDTDEATANAKYLGKIVEVKGTISEKITDSKGKITITLQGADLAGVGCEFEPGAQKHLTGLSEGQEVCVKGICTGVLMDVVLADCVITKK